MVQILLVLILVGFGVFFLFALKLYLLLNDLSSKLDELESDLLKTKAEFRELQVKVEQMESKINFLQNQFKLIVGAIRRDR